MKKRKALDFWRYSWNYLWVAKSISQEGRVAELDGIRGVAILLVLVIHFARVEGLPQPLASVIQAGWCGVDLFFVLSGFLITGILLKSKNKNWYFREFYRNRVLRIFPIYYGYLLVCLLVGAGPLVRQLPYWFYGGNFMNAAGLSIPVMNHFWSLAIEEQFYLLWPVVVYKLSTRALIRLCVLMIPLTVACRFVAAHFHTPSPEFIYTFTPLRWDALLFGALVACLRETGALERLAGFIKWAALAGALIFFAGVYLGRGTWYTSPGMERYGYLGADLLFAGLIAAVAMWRGAPGFRMARSPLLTFFGKYSYGIYMLHFPISRVLVAAMPFKDIPILHGLTSLAAGTALSVGAALISWNLLEKRCLELRHRWSAFGREAGLAAVGGVRER